MSVKCYIVDDVLSVVKVLRRIIEEKDICEIIGAATDPKVAEEEIVQYEPDLVLVDLLMPDTDGISLVRKIKQKKPNINFIMISQVSNNDMVAEAYKEGIEFFIRKPINVIEVETVMKRVIDWINMENMIGGIRQMMGITSKEPSKGVRNLDKKEQRLRDIKYILGLLGILGEKGTKDILSICNSLVMEEKDYERDTIKEYAALNEEDERMVKQRIRRAVKKALSNVANLGIEDYYNEIFQTYAHMVFDFEAIRTEMDYIRGKNQAGGKASIVKFLEGLMTFSEIKE